MNSPATARGKLIRQERLQTQTTEPLETRFTDLTVLLLYFRRDSTKQMHKSWRDWGTEQTPGLQIIFEGFLFQLPFHSLPWPLSPPSALLQVIWLLITPRGCRLKEGRLSDNAVLFLACSPSRFCFWIKRGSFVLDEVTGWSEMPKGLDISLTCPVSTDSLLSGGLWHSNPLYFLV